MGQTALLEDEGQPRGDPSPADRPPIAEVGQIIGDRYVVEAYVGEGGMGRVYRVRHLELGKSFALKIMHSVLMHDEAARESFFREARLASWLLHPHFVSIIDFGEDPRSGAYMVME